MASWRMVKCVANAVRIRVANIGSRIRGNSKHGFLKGGERLTVGTQFLAGASIADCQDAAIADFLTGASVAHCKDAATADFLAGASVAHCKDAATDNFLAGASVAHWKDPAIAKEEKHQT